MGEHKWIETFDPDAVDLAWRQICEKYKIYYPVSTESRIKMCGYPVGTNYKSHESKVLKYTQNSKSFRQSKIDEFFKPKSINK